MDINAFEKKGDEPCLEWIRIEMIRLIADQAKEKKKTIKSIFQRIYYYLASNLQTNLLMIVKGGFFFSFKGVVCESIAIKRSNNAYSKSYTCATTMLFEPVSCIRSQKNLSNMPDNPA